MPRFLALMNAAGADGGAGGGGPAASAAPSPDAVPPGGPTTPTAPVAPTTPAAPTTPLSITAPGATPAKAAPSDNPVLAYAYSEMAALGVGAEHPAMVLANSGNFDMLEVEALKSGKSNAQALVKLMKEQYATAQAQAQTQATATHKAVTEVFGGEENWKAASQWASDNATPEEAQAINGMFAAGGLQAKYAAMALAAMWERSGAAAPAAAPAVTTAAPAVGAGANGPLSRTEYTEAVQSLRRQLGSGFDQSPQYHALRARLAAGLRR